MKKSLLAIGLCASTLLAKEDNWNLNNSFAFWADAAFYRRAYTHNHDLIIDQSQGKADSCGVCHYDACDAKHLAKKFKYEPGFKVGFDYMTLHTVLEASYLWLTDWHSHCFVSAPGKLYFSENHPDDVQDFSGADTGRAKYESWFQNGELNYFRYSSPHRGNRFAAAWMIGLRYIYLAEKLEVSFTKALNTSSYHIHVWNNIPTLQVGAAIAWNPMKTLFWDLIAKVGMGFDWNCQHTRLGDLNNSEILRNYTKSGFATPVVADASLALTYQPVSWLNLHTAYQIIYLNGVALAPDQLVKHTSSDHFLDANGCPLIHGWTAGLAFSF